MRNNKDFMDENAKYIDSGRRKQSKDSERESAADEDKL